MQTIRPIVHRVLRIQPGELQPVFFLGLTFFAMMAGLEGEPYSLTAVAAAPTSLLSLDRETLQELLNCYPQIAGDLMRTLALRLNQAAAATQQEWL